MTSAPHIDNRWRAHLAATLKIGLPIVGAQLAQQAAQVTDTVMLGWLSAETLAAGVLGSTLLFIGFIVSAGFASAVMPLAATAAGNDDDRGVRRSVRMGLWVVTLFVALMMAPLWFSEALLLALGQEPELAALAQTYLRIAQWALFPMTILIVLRSYLAALERTQIVLWATVVGAVLNAVLNWMLIFGNWGAPALGIAGAAVATLGTHTLTLIITLVYVMRSPALARYELFNRIYRPDWEAFREVVRLGWPISATVLAEVGLFAASSFMMGWLGTIQLAAHGIALQVISILFMIPYGLSNAATARAGRAVGRFDRLGLDRAGKTVLALAIGFSVLSAALLWLAPVPLIQAFLSKTEPAAAEIITTGVALLVVAAVFQLVDSLQVTSLALLRGLKDTRVPMVIAIASYWVIGAPVAYALGFWAGWGGVGVWSGLAIGLLVACVLLTWRFLARERLGLLAERVEA